MCGIAGIARFQDSAPIDPTWPLAMTAALRHRGPDDEGYAFFSHEVTQCLGGPDTPPQVWESHFPFSPKERLSNFELGTLNVEPSLVLAHRRLSILDVSPRGHQPMCDGSQRFWISYNGEIYNYLELKAELEALGHTFLSNCDTEVILNAYLQWGSACVQHFNGMWAFVIYDSMEQRLFCSRDRFGVKPFYYFHDERYFAFASEHKALLSLPFVKKRLNEEAVFDYLVLMQTEKEETGFFQDIVELMPGHSMQVHLFNGQLQKSKYYTLPFEASFGELSSKISEDYVTSIRDLLMDSVRMRLRSDVTVGACLSGGIDSSSLVCMADRLKEGAAPLHVFTAAFPGMEVDESMWAKQIVDITDTNWHTVDTKADDLLNEYETLIYAQDIPFFSSSTLSQHKVMQLIQQSGIKVTLDGQGADELFSGYNRHLSVHVLELAKNREMKSLFNYFASDNKTSSDPTLKLWARRFVESMSPDLSYRLLKDSKFNFSVLTQDFWDRHKARYVEQREGPIANLNEYLYQEYTGHHLKYLMRTADRNSMWHSVESRVPFADDVRLAEHVFAIPSAYKIQNGLSKTLLRESMKGILPENVRCRLDKKGFVTPEYLWFQQLKEPLKELVTENIAPFVEVKKLKKDWDTIFENQLKGNTLGISRFLILSMWRKRFGV